jgi:hypothetical protein
LVEVKGTEPTIGEVLVTRNEIELARAWRSVAVTP